MYNLLMFSDVFRGGREKRASRGLCLKSGIEAWGVYVYVWVCLYVYEGVGGRKYIIIIIIIINIIYHRNKILAITQKIAN